MLFFTLFHECSRTLNISKFRYLRIWRILQWKKVETHKKKKRGIQMFRGTAPSVLLQIPKITPHKCLQPNTPKFRFCSYSPIWNLGQACDGPISNPDNPNRTQPNPYSITRAHFATFLEWKNSSNKKIPPPWVNFIVHPPTKDFIVLHLVGQWNILKESIVLRLVERWILFD